MNLRSQRRVANTPGGLDDESKELLLLEIEKAGGIVRLLEKGNTVFASIRHQYPHLFGSDKNKLQKSAENKVDKWKRGGVIKYLRVLDHHKIAPCAATAQAGIIALKEAEAAPPTSEAVTQAQPEPEEQPELEEQAPVVEQREPLQDTTRRVLFGTPRTGTALFQATPRPPPLAIPRPPQAPPRPTSMADQNINLADYPMGFDPARCTTHNVNLQRPELNPEGFLVTTFNDAFLREDEALVEGYGIVDHTAQLADVRAGFHTCYTIPSEPDSLLFRKPALVASARENANAYIEAMTRFGQYDEDIQRAEMAARAAVMETADREFRWVKFKFPAGTHLDNAVFSRTAGNQVIPVPTPYLVEEVVMQNAAGGNTIYPGTAVSITWKIAKAETVRHVNVRDRSNNLAGDVFERLFAG